MEGPFPRWLRLGAILLFAVTAFVPVYSCGHSPRSHGNPEPTPSRTDPVGGRVPVVEISRNLTKGWERSGVAGALHGVREWYPYLLIPFWIVGLLFSRARRAATRSIVAWGLLGLSVSIAAYELPYLADEYRGFLPGSLHAVEIALVWAFVCLVLFLRRPGRGLREPEACVSAQALLGALHGLTFVVGDIRSWAPAADVGALARAIAGTYRPAFWVAVLALFVAAVPGYLRSGTRPP